MGFVGRWFHGAAGTAAVQWLCFALGARTFCPLVACCSGDRCGPKPMQPGRLRSKSDASHWDRGHSVRWFLIAAGTAALQSPCSRVGCGPMALLHTGSADILSAGCLLQRGPLRSKAHAAGTAAVQSPCSRDGCAPKPMQPGRLRSKVLLRTGSTDILSAGFSLQPGRLRSKAHVVGSAAVQRLCFALGARTFCPLVVHAVGTAALHTRPPNGRASEFPDAGEGAIVHKQQPASRQ